MNGSHRMARRTWMDECALRSSTGYKIVNSKMVIAGPKGPMFLILAIFLWIFQISRLCGGAWVWRSSASRRDWKPKGGRTSWRDTLQLECTGILYPEISGSSCFSPLLLALPCPLSLSFSATLLTQHSTQCIEFPTIPWNFPPSSLTIVAICHCSNFHHFFGLKWLKSLRRDFVS